MVEVRWRYDDQHVDTYPHASVEQVAQRLRETSVCDVLYDEDHNIAHVYNHEGGDLLVATIEEVS